MHNKIELLQFLETVSTFFLAISTPQSLRAVQILFTPMASRWAGRHREKACISGTVRCRMFILGGDIVTWGVGVRHHGVTLI